MQSDRSIVKLISITIFDSNLFVDCEVRFEPRLGGVVSGESATTPSHQGSSGLCVYCSRKLLSFLLLLGCLSFLKALASICLILSLVTLKSRPTSSRV